MRYILITLLITLSLQASLMDSIYLIKARYHLNNREYSRAIREYLRVSHTGDRIKLNIAYCLYKEKRYTQTLNILKSIREPKLNQIRYYNMGNTLVKLGRLREALKLYKSALKFGSDRDVESNIKVVVAKLAEVEAKSNEKRDTLKPIRKGKDNPDRVFDTGLKDINLSETLKGLWNMGGNLGNHLSSIGDEVTEIGNIGKTPNSKKGEFENGISFRYWDKKMDRKSLDTLLIPLDEESF